MSQGSQTTERESPVRASGSGLVGRACAPVLDAIDAAANEIVATLRELIRIRSVTGEEAEIGSYVERFCRETGFRTEVLEAEPGRPNVLATWDTGLPGPHFLLNDHLDTIPPGPPEYWTHPPFAGETADGRMYGRGAIDTKSGLTTILMAARVLRHTGAALRGKLSLLFTCDEEVGGAKGIQHIARCGRLQADMALVAEPTTLQIEIATKARLNLGITTRGVATHGARPWLGHNAIDDMADVIVALRGLEGVLAERRHPLLGRPSMNVGIIAGGTVPNMVPNKCRVEVDRRLIPSETQDSAIGEIQAILDQVARDRPGFSATLEKLLWWPGYVLDRDVEIVQRAVRAFEAVTGRTPTVAGKDAGTDASWIFQLAGIPVVMFSPGDGKQAMNADESVAISDLVLATKVVAQLTLDILSVH